MITDKEIEDLAKDYIHFPTFKDWGEEEEYYHTKTKEFHAFQDGFKAAQSKLYSEEEIIKCAFYSYNLRSMDKEVRSTKEMNNWIAENILHK